MKPRYFFILFMSLFGCLSSKADAKDTSESKVSILTFAAGNDIYELEGHAALRVVSPCIGDTCVDWGVFDFDSPNFVYRFTAGQTDYTLACRPTRFTLDRARARGRRVVENILDLDTTTINQVVALLLENIKPENRIYRYNYVKDNCSTRVYQIVERALNDTITFGPLPDGFPEKPTFRRLMTYFHKNYPWYQLGIDLSLGSGIDYEVTNRETLYAPLIMQVQLPKATVAGKKLVKETKVLVEGNPGGLVEGPTPFYATPLFVALLILAITILVTTIDLTRRHLSRWFDTLQYTLLGIMGLVLTFLIFISVHEATSPNWLYLWANPLCFIGALVIWLKNCKKVVFYWQIANFVLLLALIIIGITGIQSINVAVYPLVLADMTRSMLYIYRNVKQTA